MLLPQFQTSNFLDQHSCSFSLMPSLQEKQLKKRIDHECCWFILYGVLNFALRINFSQMKKLAAIVTSLSFLKVLSNDLLHFRCYHSLEYNHGLLCWVWKCLEILSLLKPTLLRSFSSNSFKMVRFTFDFRLLNHPFSLSNSFEYLSGQFSPYHHPYLSFQSSDRTFDQPHYHT